MADRFNEYLKKLKTNHRIAVSVEWLNEDESVAFEITEDADMSGQLSVTLQNGIRSTGTLRLTNIERYPINIDSIWFNQKIKINIGLYLDDGTPYLLPQGVYYIKDPQISELPTGKTLSLNLMDKYSHFTGDLFGVLEGIYETSVGMNIYNAIIAVLQEDRGNGKMIDSKPPLLSSYYLTKTWNDGGTIYSAINMPYTSRIDLGGTYSDVLDDYAKILACHIYYGKDGALVVEPTNEDVSDETKPILFDFKLTEGEYLGSTTTYEFSKVFNEVQIYGAVLSGKQTKGLAQNNNINSPTCIKQIGRKIAKPIINETYYSDSQSNAYAEYLLKQYTVLNRSIAITSEPIPHIELNKIITIDRPNAIQRPERFLVTGYTIPISTTGEMTINAVSTNDLVFK